MAFWVVKARRSRTDLRNAVRPREAQRWVTARPPRAWKPTDHVFCWQSAPDLAVLGLGTIVDIPDRTGAKAAFDVRYDEGPFDGRAGIDVLRGDHALGGASFLKAGAAGTVFPLNPSEAHAVVRHLGGTASDRTRLRSWLEAGRTGDVATMAISIRQPYAELILRGIKTTEFRSKPTKRRGRVFIYAAGTPGPDAVWEEHRLARGTLPTGVIVGVIDIMTCVSVGDGFGYRLAHPTRVEARAPRAHPQPTWFRPFP